MSQAIGAVSLLVRDYDEAIAFYRGKLGFRVAEDTPLGGGKRWVLLAPPGSVEARLLLARATSAEEQAGVGRQGAGRVWLFLHTDDFGRDHRRMQERGIRFLEEPRHEAYGTVAVFEDLEGNKWDLLQPRAGSPA
jgi:catechol 2,3-dioxygenase-like lactoylglutathione lyase family enzyme